MKKTIMLIFLTMILLLPFVSSGATENQALRQVKFREFVTVQGGTFKQQSVIGDDPAFNHTISTFRIGKYEVTYELWYTVITWATSKGYKIVNEGREGKNGTDGEKPSSAKYEPVTRVNWRDVIVWCNAYSEMEGLQPVYTHNGSVIKDSSISNSTASDNAECNWAGNGYRLPTEGEWQFAASSKGRTPFNYASGATADFNNEEANKAVAVYDENAKKTANVGTKKPNLLGIYDMSGNIWEWCWDWIGKYSSDAKNNYRGPDRGSYRIRLGGSWEPGALFLVIGFRSYNLPSFRSSNMGFRLSRSN